jgi:hypothetical protein
MAVSLEKKAILRANAHKKAPDVTIRGFLSQ